MKIEDLPEVMEPKHVREFLDIGRRQTYELLKNPPFKIIRLERTIKIPKRKFIEWFLGEEQES